MKHVKRIIVMMMICFLIAGSLPASAFAATADPEQILETGGPVTDVGITISKTIAKTDAENVFEITLKVDSTNNVKTMISDPDTAVVIVLDVSNTMNEDFPAESSTSRADAAIESAQSFVETFAGMNSPLSRIGLVTFNTNAYTTVAMQQCCNDTQAGVINDKIEAGVNAIVGADKYNESHDRFTNIEAGLKLAKALLDKEKNEHKYIIFLSDGFPTTYVNTSAGAYKGYDPYTGSGTVGKNGVFHDDVSNKYCTYGTSYSDKAAIKARTQAEAIKKAGIQIFTIGIDVGTQTIDGYERPTASYSIIDRTGTTYEIGSANSKTAYENWLQYSIGSGFYYPSTDKEGLDAAYAKIIKELQKQRTEDAALQWIVTDPMPLNFGSESFMEFIGFKDQKGNVVDSVKGKYDVGAENTASFISDSETINWAIKESGYTKTGTHYIFELKYLVRLTNEASDFVEYTKYETNGETTLNYQYTDSEGITRDDRISFFPIPAVQGFLGDLSFTKYGTDPTGDVRLDLKGAEFTLFHDPDNCAECSYLETVGEDPVSINDIIAVSGITGEVKFTGIPSGHSYTLVETAPPDGYLADNNIYKVVVSYDSVTVTVTDAAGIPQEWNAQIVDPPVVYNVTHEFISGTEGKELPDEIKERVPDDQTGIPDQTEVYPTDDFDKTDLVVEDGIWSWKEWDKEKDVIDGADVKFIGVWVFVPTYNVTHDFISGTEGKELPDEIKARIPSDQTGIPDQTEVFPTDDFDKSDLPVKGGVWSWKEWDKESDVIDGADVEFIGVWVYEEIPQTGYTSYNMLWISIIWACIVSMACAIKKNHEIAE